MQRVDPVAFLGQHRFDESLVLSFRFLPRRAQVDLVLDYAAGVLDLVGQVGLLAPGITITDANRPHRDLRRLTFEGVSHFRRIPEPTPRRRSARPAIPDDDEELAPPDAAGATLARLALKQRPRWHEAAVVLPATAYTFRFTGLSVDQRIGHGRQVGPGQWEYQDVLTGEPFDFFRPFADR
jgi:hypothetical protein